MVDVDKEVGREKEPKDGFYQLGRATELFLSLDRLF
jgi:hypothetical protein